MTLLEIQETVNKLMQAKTIASCEVTEHGIKIIFEDLSFTSFYVDYLGKVPTLGMTWGKEKVEDSSSN